MTAKKSTTSEPFDLADYLPTELRDVGDLQRAIPAIAKDERLLSAISNAVDAVPTHHELVLGDSRQANLSPESVHLVVTSPPYWTLKQYRDSDGQLGHVADYEDFLRCLPDSLETGADPRVRRMPRYPTARGRNSVSSQTTWRCEMGERSSSKRPTWVGVGDRLPEVDGEYEVRVTVPNRPGTIVAVYWYEMAAGWKSTQRGLQTLETSDVVEWLDPTA